MDMPVMRSLPQNIEAEQSVLGSMIIDRAAIARSAEALSADDFYRDSHKVIFSTILEMSQKDIPVDMITLIEHLRVINKLEASGGITYITDISTSVPSTANLKSYIDIVAQKSMLRKLIKASNEIIEDSYENQDDVEKVVDSAEKRIFEIAEKRNSSDFEHLSAVLE